MRIAYVISTLDQCGPVNVLYGIAANLCDANEIVVFTLAPEPKGSRAGDFEELGIAVKCVVGGRAQSFLFGRRVLLRALEEFGPDVVHSHGFRATVLCCDLPYPKIVTVHNCIYEDYLTTYGRAKATWMTRLEVAALRRFDEVVACSKSNADYLHTEYGLTASVVRNGVDQTKFFPLTAKPRKELRKRLGISDDALALVATGGCSERKRTLPLAEAFSSALKETGADAVLHVFGEGPDYVRCKSLGIFGSAEYTPSSFFAKSAISAFISTALLLMLCRGCRHATCSSLHLRRKVCPWRYSRQSVADCRCCFPISPRIAR